MERNITIMIMNRSIINCINYFGSFFYSRDFIILGCSFWPNRSDSSQVPSTTLLSFIEVATGTHLIGVVQWELEPSRY
ncbi:hypothetical protein RIF29_29672 [Crotalaria pallida]|uniref:Uncharacterized protein n=1 Tax=Crotalaria pallida TaxID=3830 RepID=A0AAN9ELS1_CROPI